MGRIQIIEADSSDDEEEEEDSTLPFISATAFEGSKKGYVYQMGTQGVGYYSDPTIQKVQPNMTRITIEAGDDSSDEEEDDMTTSNNITIEQKEETEEKSDEENKGEEKTQTTSTGAADGADGAVDPTALKKAATSAFKSGDLAKALELFQQASSAFEKYDDSSNIEARIKCLNNAALCGQHLGDNDLVVSVCTTVLTLDKENVKALLRRGIAYEELADYNNALDDMCTIIRVDPSQKSVADSMERLLSYISGTAKPPTKTTKKVIKKVAQELKKKNDSTKINRKRSHIPRHITRCSR